MTTTYKNPWWKPREKGYGPEFYTTEATPTKYRGFEIYHRQSEVWDIVKDGSAVSQCAGFNGAKREIDAILQNNGATPD